MKQIENAITHALMLCAIKNTKGDKNGYIKECDWCF